jgi:transmembrane sensor
MKVQHQIDELLTLRASEWFEILRNPTEAEREAFIAWLGESRRHVQEFLEVAAVDDAVGDMPVGLRENLDALLERITPDPVRLPPRARPLAQDKRPIHPFAGVVALLARHWRAAGLVAACACLSVVAILLWRTFDPATQYATGIGEQRTIELADTSVVTLNADSQVRWQLDDAQRDVELRRGEAIFDVAHDASRPFRVHTRAGVVQAIGTQFNVYTRTNGDTRVSVLEGRVLLTALSTASDGRAQNMILSADQEADIRLDGSIQRDPKAVVENTVAWRKRRLAFSDVLLEDIVAEFNRYNRTPRLRLEDVPLGTYRFAGIFDATDPESLTALLAREPDLLIERRDGEIVIRRR